MTASAQSRRTTSLKPIAAQGSPSTWCAGPGHLWDVRFASSWGSRIPLDVVLVQPGLVVEIDADTAVHRGAWRHPCAS